jgi:hypothetical protein
VLSVLRSTGCVAAKPSGAATLKGLRVVEPLVVDTGQGRIESEPFAFSLGRGQVIWVSFAIAVSRTGPQHTTVQVQPRVYLAVYCAL